MSAPRSADPEPNPRFPQATPAEPAGSGRDGGGSLEGLLDRLPVPLAVIETGSARVRFVNGAARGLLGGVSPPAQSAADYAGYFCQAEDGRRLSADELPALRAARGERIDGEVVTYHSPRGVKSVVVHSMAAPSESAVVVSFQDVSRVVDSERRLRTLSEAGELLGSSLDYEKTLDNVARLVVPGLADWCAVDVLEGAGIRALGLAHVDPAKVALAHELRRRWPPRLDEPQGMPRVIRTGQAELIEEIPDALLVETVADPELLAILRALGLRSSICVPLAARGRTIGALTLVSAESGRRYGADDLSFAEDLARRAAVAIDNARLHHEVRALNATLEQRVAERTAELLEANRELEAFSYTVSHDLRAPIRHVSGFVDLLERHVGPALDERGRRYVSTIRDSARHMGELIDALLAFSRMGRVSLARAKVSLEAVVGEAVEAVRPEAEAKGVAVRLGPLPPVLGDATLLRQVFVNLLSNAVKFALPERGPLVEVGALEAERPGEVKLFVRDNGQGFDMAYSDKLFGVFQRLHSGPEHEGTGIGLAIVRRVVQRHGGRVWAEAAAGQGATFFLTLPGAA